MKNLLVSVIVPTKNSETTIGNCLKSIQGQSYKNIQVIVVDNNSIDKTKEIAKKYTKLVFNKGPERSAQRNFGAFKAKGKYLLFVDSDMELSKSVVSDCLRIIQKQKYKALIVPEESFGESFWAKCKKLERSFYIGVDWIEAARFFPKAIFKELKGYDEKQTGTEDFDLPQKIKLKYGNKSVGRVNSFIYHNEGRLSLGYTLSKKYFYAKTAKTYLRIKSNAIYFKKQASIFERYKLFFSYPKKLFKNPVIGIGMLFMKTSEFLVGGVGFLLGNLNIGNKI